MSNINATKYRGELRCSGKVNSSCSISGSRHVTLVSNLVISHEWGQDWIAITTNITHLWVLIDWLFNATVNKYIHLLSWFFLPLHCLLFFNLRHLITPFGIFKQQRQHACTCILIWEGPPKNVLKSLENVDIKFERLRLVIWYQRPCQTGYSLLRATDC